jgi:hypothetical protein
LPWLLLGASQVVYAAADATFYISHDVFGVLTFPFVSDVLYLAHYPLVVGGLMLVIRRRTPGRDVPGLLDAAALPVAASTDIPVTAVACTLLFALTIVWMAQLVAEQPRLAVVDPLSGLYTRRLL